MKTVLSLSGGIDSATALAQALSQGGEVVCVLFRYGCRHERYEMVAAKNICRHYNIRWTELNLAAAMYDFKSSILRGQSQEVPQGHYTDDCMKSTIVPGRNTIFASVLMGVAQSIEADAVLLGIQDGPNSIYPDCRPKYFEALQKVYEEATEGKVKLRAPFLYVDKPGIIKYGLELGVPYELTRSCYQAQSLACGRCGACSKRLEAFAANNTKDPVEYETV